MKNLINKLASPVTFILIGMVSRIIPHPANFVPIAAMAIFGGTFLPKKQALILPILAMIMSDFFIGFDNLPMRLTVYGSFLISVLIGFYLKKHNNPKNVVFGSLISSVIFFITTNFMVYASSGIYNHTLTGLIECYTLAIPFFRNTILGDLFYTGVFFVSWELVFSAKTKFQLAQQPKHK